MNLLLVGLGGALGSMLRYLMGGWMQKTLYGFPAGILFINILGSFVLGMVAAALTKQHPGYMLLALGLCGGFTTFSTFSLEAWELLAAGKITAACFYIAFSVVGAIAAFGFGLYLTRITFQA